MTRPRLTALMRIVASLAACLAVGHAVAATTVLYDPSLPGTSNDNPVNGGWLSGVVPATTTFSALGASITQTALGDTVGYTNHSPFLAFLPTAPLVNPAFPALQRSTGYRLTFGLAIVSESHIRDERAGFSVTLIGSDKTGIEIGFQQTGPAGGRVFAQNDTLSGGLFTFGENAATALPLSRNLWNLDVHGNTYALGLASGGPAVLSGTLRNYSDYTGDGRNAYSTPNFLFLGDNTRSAQASFVLGFAAITTPVPEPSAALLMACGLALLGTLARRRRGASA